MRKRTLWVVAIFTLTAIATLAAQAATRGSGPAAADGIVAVALPKVAPEVFRGDVRKLPQVPTQIRTVREPQEPEGLKQTSGRAVPQAPNPAEAQMPAPIQNFAGLSRTDTCTGGQCGGGIPPDTNGEVGHNYYIQAVNTAYGIYDKTGKLLASFTENALWSGSGTFCGGHGGGDPVVVYDPMADRWILTHLAYSGSGTQGPFYECLAVSKTSNPVTGGWTLYAVPTDTGVAGQPPANTLNDYPKFGIWTDCLYYSANGFLNGATYNGGEFGSFSRSDMYAGVPLTGALGFAPSTNDFFSMIPSNLSAPGASGLPAAGTPNYYVQESLTAHNFRVRTFTAGTNCGSPAGAPAVLSGLTIVNQTSYDGSGTGVPQPNTTGTLDPLFDRMMQKVQYRKVGSTESLWVVHTVQNSGATERPQWAQIDVTGGKINPTPVQQQIYGPDSTLYRWMPSIAADRDGNVALAYSTSNGTSPNFPSIAYSGRLAGDPLNTLPQTETQLVAGNGSQTNNCSPTGGGCPRWGDYSSLSVDPSDGCTFWVTNEYYVNQANGSAGNWNTRIGSFKFPSCVPNVSITKTADNPSVSAGSLIGFTVKISNAGANRVTGVVFSDPLPAGAGVSWSIDPANSDSGWSVTGSPPSQSLALDLKATINPGASTTAHVLSATTPSSCQTYDNTASFTANTESGSASASTTVNCPSLAISKSADAASVSAGAQIGYTVTLNNSGAGTASGLSVSDPLPAGSGVNWALDAAGSSSGWSVTGSPPSESLAYSPTTLAANTSTHAHVVSSTSAGSCKSYANTAGYASSNGGSGQASASTTVNCPSLAITKTADAASVSAGAQIGYTVTLANSGAGTASGLSISDPLPAGSGVSWSLDAAGSSSGWSVAGSPPNQILSYSPSALAAGTSTHAHVLSATSGSSCKSYSNTATYLSGNGGSGQASASTTVNCPSLAIAKTADAASVSAGSQIGYTVTLGNSGAGTASGLSLSDPLPAGSGVNWSLDAAHSDSGWSVTGTPPSQSLAYSPSTLTPGTSTHAHVVSATIGGSCKSYANTAGYAEQQRRLRPGLGHDDRQLPEPRDRQELRMPPRSAPAPRSATR